MKLYLASLILLCLALAAVPAMAQGSYNNGPVNGQIDAWTINFGFSVSDTFQVSGSGGADPLNSLSFYAWLDPGDSISNVELQVGNSAFGNTLFDGTLSLTQSGCSTNGFGFDVCKESSNFGLGPILGAGNYWLTLQNASVPSGDPTYWDENSGVGCTSPGCPSVAQENTLGTIPSEAFTVGWDSSTTNSTSGCAVAGLNNCPEPSSLLLFGSGIAGLARMLRLKIRW
jgi:hypothetical protein